MPTDEVCGVQGCGKEAKRSLSTKKVKEALPELKLIREDGLLVALRSEEADLEVLQHSDSPEDGAALDIVLPGGGFEAWEEVVAVGELHDDRVAFLLRLHRLTG